MRKRTRTNRKYSIGSNESIGRNRIKDWERIYLEEGAEGLLKERRGKKSTRRPLKLDKRTE